jgi:hypothetical protein
MKNFIVAVIDMRFILIQLYFSTICFSVFSKSENNITLIVNDSKVSNIEVKKIVDDIMNANGKNIHSLKIIHYSKNAGQNELWNYKKMAVEYRFTQTNCLFNFCESIETLISSLRSFDKNKLYYCEGRPNCTGKDLSIETSDLPTRNLIRSKIEEEIIVNKSLKKVQTLFFIIDSDKNTVPVISFETSSITIKKGEKVQLKPIINGAYEKLVWEPNSAISCIDCVNPVVQPETDVIYTVKAISQNGCESNVASVNIKVQFPEEKQNNEATTDCNCSNSTKILNDVFNKFNIKKYIYDQKYKFWRITANSSGDWEFDLLFTPNCAELFKVDLVRKDKKGEEIVWSNNYEVNQINYLSGNNYLHIYKDYFSIRMDLNEIKLKLKRDQINEDVYYKIIIKSTDKYGKQCKQYSSPNLVFFPCID